MDIDCGPSVYITRCLRPIFYVPSIRPSDDTRALRAGLFAIQVRAVALSSRDRMRNQSFAIHVTDSIVLRRKKKQRTHLHPFPLAAKISSFPFARPCSIHKPQLARLRRVNIVLISSGSSAQVCIESLQASCTHTHSLHKASIGGRARAGK